MSRVVLAMSGGVDSSVAASLLLEAGHDVIGLFMRHGAEPVNAACETTLAPSAGPLVTLPVVSPTRSSKQGCCSVTDGDDARRVARKLDIPFYAINFENEFGQIMDYFATEYRAGRTPNPCVMCNNWLKFGKLFEYAASVDADFVATGHYARIVPGANGPELHRGLDAGKDQSYVLFGIERARLAKTLFPIGEFSKEQIRARARELGLRVADKPDSQEICFVPDQDHVGFIERKYGASDTSGEFVDTSGKVLGRHAGIERFTIGQRKGLGMAFGEPRFVLRIEADSRRVVLGRHDELACSRLEGERANWHIDPPTDWLACRAKIRSQSRPAAARVRALSNHGLEVEFDEPQFGVAPGQAVVCYAGDRVLGGGWIR